MRTRKKDINNHLFVSYLTGNATDEEKNSVDESLAESQDKKRLLVELTELWQVTALSFDDFIDTDKHFAQLKARINSTSKI